LRFDDPSSGNGTMTFGIAGRMSVSVIMRYAKRSLPVRGRRPAAWVRIGDNMLQRRPKVVACEFEYEAVAVEMPDVVRSFIEALRKDRRKRNQRE
jgi:hypothetical protein